MILRANIHRNNNDKREEQIREQRAANGVGAAALSQSSFFVSGSDVRRGGKCHVQNEGHETETAQGRKNQYGIGEQHGCVGSRNPNAGRKGKSGSAGAITSDPDKFLEWTQEDTATLEKLIRIIVGLGGGRYLGLQHGGREPLVLFEPAAVGPQTTLAIKLSSLSAKSVQQKIRKSLEDFLREIAYA
jgi:hypothetical protein